MTICGAAWGSRYNLWRKNWFEGAEVQLNTVGVLGLDELDGTVISDQFQYTNESNFLYAPLDTTPQGITLPSPARLEMQAITAYATVGELIVTHAYNGISLGMDFYLSDAAGTGGTSGADATCCGGTYRTLGWSDTAETVLETWDLTAAFCVKAGGKYFKPIVRLGADLAYTDLQFKLQLMVTATSNVLGESSWSPCTAAKRIQEISTLRLPPFKLEDPSNAAGLTLALVARRNTSGAHSIRLDFIQLMPMDGWKTYDPIYPLPEDWTLIENGPADLVTSLDASGNELITHSGRGAPFMIAPGLRNAFIFIWMNSAGGAVIHDQMLVKLWVKKRKRF